MYMLPKRDSLTQGRTQPSSEGGKWIIHSNGNQEKAGVAVLRSGKMDFETRLQSDIKRDII